MMISLIWVLWIINQWLVLVITLNIFIAIINQSYDQTMSNYTLNKYRYRAELNREMRLIGRKMGLDPPLDCMVLSSSIEESQDS